MSVTADAAPTLFECPNCKETNDSSANTCRSCGTAIDHEAATAAAAKLAKVKLAVSDSRYMSTCALAIPVFFILCFVPHCTWVGGIGFAGLSFLVPTWALLWWIKYARLKADDKDYRNARTTAKACGIVVTLVLLGAIIVPFALSLIQFFSGTPNPAAR